MAAITQPLWVMDRPSRVEQFLMIMKSFVVFRILMP